MRRMRSFLSPLAVVAFALAAHPVAAQQLATAAVRTSGSAPVAGDNPLVRPIAIYSFEGVRDAEMPSEVTVADSLGIILGSYRVRGSSVPRSMNVEVDGSDLFLQAPTTAGTLTLVIYTPGEIDRSSPVIGRWMLGAKQGELLRRQAR